jgi:UDP-N-acetylglucosamine 2-epimerase (non-hydrolysing)
VERTKVLVVAGTRPEAIKLAPVVRSLGHSPRVSSRLCVTAQHREMLDDVLGLFGLRSDYDLELMRAGQRPVDILASVLTGITDVIQDFGPDWVIVQGDTTSALGAALAASYRGCSVGHVEAGLRTYDRRMPFPEELNRCAISVCADLHFAPTQQSAANLLEEKVPAERVLVTGNTGIDSLHLALHTQPTRAATRLLRKVGDRKLVLVTAHRRENFGEPFAEVCEALGEIARSRPDVVLVYPVHPNPAVNGPAREALGGLDNVMLTDPVDYFTMAHILRSCCIVITDSGGLQEEAPALGKPVLVLRDVTERPETIDAGVARLVGTRRHDIVKAAVELLDDPGAYASMAKAVSPYGDGRASARIVDALLGRRVSPFGTTQLQDFELDVEDIVA